MKYRYENVLCKRVIDADTVDVEIDFGFKIRYNARLRLHRINAYETRTRDKEEKKKGLLGKAWLKELIEGKTIAIETIKVGKFGRIVAEVYGGESNEYNINDALVSEGHAIYKDY